MSPGNMRAKIDAFAKATGQPVPRNPGEYVRACLESLALTYRDAMDTLESLLGKSIDRLHIVGGGGQNALLNQMTADATGKEVIIGPFEATAIGNALTQAIGAGQVRDLAHLRKIVAASFDLQTCRPQARHLYEAQLARFHALKSR
jgi:rhamnulokinase